MVERRLEYPNAVFSLTVNQSATQLDSDYIAGSSGFLRTRDSTPAGLYAVRAYCPDQSALPDFNRATGQRRRSGRFAALMRKQYAAVGPEARSPAKRTGSMQ